MAVRLANHCFDKAGGSKETQVADKLRDGIIYVFRPPLYSHPFPPEINGKG